MGRLQYWQDKLESRLRKLHGTHWKIVFKKLMRKATTLKASLKKRSREADVHCEISVHQIREMIVDVYGKTCKYCKTKILHKNMACDHISPLSSGGESTVDNLQFICNRCNTRKGPLTNDEYKRVLKWLNRQPEHVNKYILRKLSKGDLFR